MFVKWFENNFPLTFIDDQLSCTQKNCSDKKSNSFNWPNANIKKLYAFYRYCKTLEFDFCIWIIFCENKMLLRQRNFFLVLSSSCWQNAVRKNRFTNCFHRNDSKLIQNDAIVVRYFVAFVIHASSPFSLQMTSASL